MEAVYKVVSVIVAIIAVADLAYTFTIQPSGGAANDLESLLSLLLWAKVVFALGCGIGAIVAFWRTYLRILVAGLAVVTGMMAASSYSGIVDVLLTIACASLAVAAFTTRPIFE